MIRRSFFAKLTAGVIGAFLPYKGEPKDFQEVIKLPPRTVEVQMRPRDFGWKRYLLLEFFEFNSPPGVRELASFKNIGIRVCKVDLEDNHIFLNTIGYTYELFNQVYADKVKPSKDTDHIHKEMVNIAFRDSGYILVSDSLLGREFVQWCIDNQYEFLLAWDKRNNVFKTIELCDEKPKDIYYKSPSLYFDGKPYDLQEADMDMLSKPLQSCLVWLEQNIKQYE